MFDSEHCPKRFKDSLERYVIGRIEPGDFLRAMLENNLKETLGRAGEEAYANLGHIMNYIYNRLPSGVWGSSEKVRDHLAGKPPGKWIRQDDYDSWQFIPAEGSK